METFGYNSYGYLSTISAGGSTRFTLTSMNARDQLTGATYGSNLLASYGFDTYGYPTSTATGSVQDYRYSFDPVTGNLNSRQNYKRSLSESFLYDNLERLTTVTGPQNLAMTYSANGNIQTKSDISSSTAFTYGTYAGPYALTGVTSSTGVIPTTNQTATYNSFEKVSTLNEGVYAASFVYNSDNQRAKMTITQNGSALLTRWYAGSRYMKETASGVSKEYTYLGGDAYSAPVVAVTQSGTTSYYYLLRDYLGNITHQVNTSNAVVAEYNFDAWGRRRSADDWNYTLDANDLNLVADRGFTGHEYLKYFNLYNMNGRLYDPLVGRFLNADPYVQMPDFSQNYNRYTYCLNNPLKFTDPSGYRLAGPEYDSSIDAVNAYLGYMTDVTGAWHLNSGGGGGSSGGAMNYGIFWDQMLASVQHIPDGKFIGIGYRINKDNLFEFLFISNEYAQRLIDFNTRMALSNASNIGYGLSFDDPQGKADLNFTQAGDQVLPPTNGFFGYAGAFMFGRTYTDKTGFTWNVDFNGKASGLASIMGMPPTFIGGPLRKGEQAIKLGKYLFNPGAFHSVKKGVLSFANPKSFSHLVGTNPDIMLKQGKIWLTGTKTGGYFGKSYETEMTIFDFLKLF